ncbi:LIM domain-containing protein [Schistosoma japonicum]|nr:LIM domain-containing protein [Schistosoma japonicum]
MIFILQIIYILARNVFETPKLCFYLRILKVFHIKAKPLVKKAVEQSRQSVNELKQNFSHKPDDEAYSSSESTESANMLHCRNNRDSKTNEFPTPGITRNLVAKFSALSAAS